MIRLLVFAVLALALLTACGNYGGDTRGEARDVVVAALANRCGATGSEATFVSTAKSHYASHDAWVFVYRLNGHTLRVWAWWDDERNRDLSIVQGAC